MVTAGFAGFVAADRSQLCSSGFPSGSALPPVATEAEHQHAITQPEGGLSRPGRG
jgi:hypothetical protein